MTSNSAPQEPLTQAELADLATIRGIHAKKQRISETRGRPVGINWLRHALRDNSIARSVQWGPRLG